MQKIYPRFLEMMLLKTMFETFLHMTLMKVVSRKQSLQIRNQNLHHADPQDQLQASKETQTGTHVQQQE